MMKRKYALAGICTGVLLLLTGCAGEKASEAVTESKAEPDAEISVQDETMQAVPEGDMADLVGQDQAQLFAETTPEALAEMIPDTEVTGMGYYKRYSGEEDPDAKIKNTVEQEITGCMKEYEIISQDWECITARGIIENNALKTEEAVEVVYYLGVNDEETAVILTSAEIVSEADSVHVIPTVPFPTAEELLEMGISTDVEITFMTPYEHLDLTKENVTEIWYDEQDVQDEMTDWNYIGGVHYMLNGYEQYGHLSIVYEAYEDENAEAKWTIEDTVIGVVKAEETGMEW